MTLSNHDTSAFQTSGTVILTCNTLEDEISLCLKKSGLAAPVIWVEAGMHNQPDKLRAHLNQTLKELKASRVLMAMGHCGGACVGLTTGDFEMIIPRTDDCLSLLMGSMEKRKEAGGSAATYFLTAGWLRHTESLPEAFARDSARFGETKARRIYTIMLKHYRRFGFINTGAYDQDTEEKKIAPLAEMLGISLASLEGDMSWLQRLLSGPWPSSEFITIPPNSSLEMSDWDWLGETGLSQTL
jgi:hypothetical protein